MKVHSLVVCLFVIVSAGLLYGQGGANGTILGTVTDNSGAVVANADVDVTNVATECDQPYPDQLKRRFHGALPRSPEPTGLRSKCRAFRSL